jgi:hypothetical protein
LSARMGRPTGPIPYKPQPPDEALREYATDKEWDYYTAYRELGTHDQAAAKCNVSRKAVGDALARLFRRAAQQGYAPEYDLTRKVPAGLSLKGTSIRYGKDGQIEAYWNKTRPQGRDPAEVVRLAHPRRIAKVSTLTDQAGRVTQQWVSEKPEDVQREVLWREFAKELAADLPRAEQAIAPELVAGDLLACYPVGDHHLGMLAWGEETGGDSYDMKISEELLVNATDYLVAAAPACETALIAFLGDFMHWDSFDTVTPTSRNLLDADGRYPKMVRAAIRAMRYMIVAALRRHRQVHVIVEIGNHDLSSSIFLMECLANVYENEPRVTIDTSPSHYHYFEFGKTLIGTHHGHGSKLDKLPNIMAADRAEAWGRSKHRYWWTGHIHQRSSQDYVGCSVESFRVLAPVDAWAAQKGYRAIRDMKGIVIHKDHGEVARHTVNPDMFRESAA